VISCRPCELHGARVGPVAGCADCARRKRFTLGHTPRQLHARCPWRLEPVFALGCMSSCACWLQFHHATHATCLHANAACRHHASHADASSCQRAHFMVATACLSRAHCVNVCRVLHARGPTRHRAQAACSKLALGTTAPRWLILP
jgi:hypothetical protein